MLVEGMLVGCFNDGQVLHNSDTLREWSFYMSLCSLMMTLCNVRPIADLLHYFH